MGKKNNTEAGDQQSAVRSQRTVGAEFEHNPAGHETFYPLRIFWVDHAARSKGDRRNTHGGPVSFSEDLFENIEATLNKLQFDRSSLVNG